jgi:hypothetical protein
MPQGDSSRAAPDFDAPPVPILHHHQAASVGRRNRGLRAGVAAGALFDRRADGEAKAPRWCCGGGQRDGEQQNERHLA